MTINRSRTRAEAETGAADVEQTPSDALVDSWARDGLVSPEQAEALKRDLRIRRAAGTPGAAPGSPRRQPAVSSLVVEGLGYLGGAIIVAAVMVLAANYWDDLSGPTRVAAAGAAAAGLTFTAVLVGDGRGAPARVRSVLLAAAVVALGGFAAILASQLGVEDGLDVATIAALCASAYALVLWWRFPTVLQQMTTLVALLVAAACVTATLGGPDGLPGVAVWTVGVVWMVLAWGGLLRPRALAEALGAAAAVFGAMLTMSTDAGTVFAVSTAFLLVAWALVVRNLLMLAVGALGVLQSTAGAVARWFPGRTAAPVVLLAVGAALVGAAILLARRSATSGAADRPRGGVADGSPRAAVLAAAAVAVASSCTILVIVAL
ncbi:hypothetical protein GCM10009798_40180 [Nocardioides panacihumi]|uniref:DUF2157 domain-containing protein n=1 Tax=Nocardioides panacihumi TaxID=400774 RepID=A0ABN2RTZ8_9ACTN